MGKTEFLCYGIQYTDVATAWFSRTNGHTSLGHVGQLLRHKARRRQIGYLTTALLPAGIRRRYSDDDVCEQLRNLGTT